MVKVLRSLIVIFPIYLILFNSLLPKLIYNGNFLLSHLTVLQTHFENGKFYKYNQQNSGILITISISPSCRTGENSSAVWQKKIAHVLVLSGSFSIFYFLIFHTFLDLYWSMTESHSFIWRPLILVIMYNLLKFHFKNMNKRSLKGSLLLLPRGGWALFLGYCISLF